MGLVKKSLLAIVSFAIAMAAACVVNFLMQVAAIFLDVVTRLESSSAFIIALWFVTGVFTTVMTVGGMEGIAGKSHASFSFVGNVDGCGHAHPRHAVDGRTILKRHAVVPRRRVRWPEPQRVAGTAPLIRTNLPG